MPLIRGISRGLWRTLSSQGAVLPLEAEVKTPIQTVQIVDDVSNTIANVPSPNGFMFINHLAGVVGEHAGVEIVAGEGGISLFFDPDLTAAAGAFLWAWTDENRPPGITPGGIFTAANLTEYSGLGLRSVVTVVDVPAPLSNLPRLTSPPSWVPDWFYVPPGRLFGVAVENTNQAWQQTMQFREALGS